jgi:hypothetical protein
MPWSWPSVRAKEWSSRGDPLQAERVRQQTQEYLDRHGWDMADDEAAWRRYQRRRMAQEYHADEW